MSLDHVGDEFMVVVVATCNGNPPELSCVYRYRYVLSWILDIDGRDAGGDFW